MNNLTGQISGLIWSSVKFKFSDMAYLKEKISFGMVDEICMFFGFVELVSCN